MSDIILDEAWGLGLEVGIEVDGGGGMEGLNNLCISNGPGGFAISNVNGRLSFN